MSYPARSVFGACGPVLVMATNARPSVESMEMIGARIVELRAHHPAVYVLVVRETTRGAVHGDPVPNGARQRGRELLRDLGPSIAGIAYVYAGDGFISSIVRMSFRTLVFMSPVPTTVVAALAEGVEWIEASPSFARDPLAGVGTRALLGLAEELSAQLRLTALQGPPCGQPAH
ncbi:MAG: hypothetical protein AB8I08_03905 [Sandaracinaceae bacterium]